MKVGVIIPTKGYVPFLKNCMLSFKNKVAYNSIFYYIADTGSTEKELKEIKNFLVEHFNDKQVKLISYNWYNFGKINNNVVFNHLNNDIEHLLFCNNDIELIDDCVTPMVNQSRKKDTGTVGCKLLYRDMSIQHAGQKFYFRTVEPNTNEIDFMITHRGLRQDSNLYSNIDEVFGNTAGFCMIKRKLFEDIGGFNEKYLECFEDVELNIQCLLKNKKNIYLGNVKAFHFESVSRSKSKTKQDNERKDFYQKLLPFITNNYKKLGKRLVL